MASAGLASIYAAQLPAATYEGDNFILCQQVCRSALKALAKFEGAARDIRSLTPSSAYLAALQTLDSVSPREAIETPQGLAQILCERAAVLVKQLSKLYAQNPDWTRLSWRCVNVAAAITEANLSRSLIKEIDSSSRLAELDTSERRILTEVYTFVRCFRAKQAGPYRTDVDSLASGWPTDFYTVARIC